MAIKRISAHPAFWNFAWDIVNAAPAAKTRTERKTIDRLLLTIEEKAHPSDRWPNPLLPISEGQRNAIAEAVAKGKGHPHDPDMRVAIDMSDDLSDRLKDALETVANKGMPSQGSHVPVSHWEAKICDILLDAIEAAAPVIPISETAK